MSEPSAPEAADAAPAPVAPAPAAAAEGAADVKAALTDAVAASKTTPPSSPAPAAPVTAPQSTPGGLKSALAGGGGGGGTPPLRTKHLSPTFAAPPDDDDDDGDQKRGGGGGGRGSAMVTKDHNAYSSYGAHQLRWVTDLATGLLVPSLELTAETRVAGKLSIRVRKARALYKAVTLGSQDPFCEVQCGAHKQRTSTAKKGGTDPLWEYNMQTFTLAGAEPLLSLSVYHDGAIKNEKIGSFKVPLRPLLQLVNPAATVQPRNAGAGASGSAADGKKPRTDSADLDVPSPKGLKAAVGFGNRAALAAAKSGDDVYHEAWYALGRDNSKVFAGEVLLRMSFEPDLDAPLPPPSQPHGPNPYSPADHNAPRPSLHYGGSKHQTAPASVLAAAVKANAAGGVVYGGGTPIALVAPSGAAATLPAGSGAAALAAAHAQANADSKAGLLSDIRKGGIRLRKASNAGLFAKPKTKKGPVFGGTLQEAVANATLRVPDICYHCVEYIRRNGLDTVGVFRVPGSNDVVTQLKAQFDRWELPELVDVASTATLLKMYLRELKDSLIPSSHHTFYLEVEDRPKGTPPPPPPTVGGSAAGAGGATSPAAGAASGVDAADEKKIERYRVLDSSIAREHRDLLHYLCAFLAECAEHAATSKMDVGNLAIVFAPTVLRGPADATPAQLMADSARATNVMKALITHHLKIFAGEQKVLAK